MYCNECASSIRHLLHSHLSLSPSCLPLSLQIVVPFIHKVFLQSTYWVKSLPQLFFHFSSRFPSSRAPLYTRRARVSIYMFSLPLFPFHLLSSVQSNFSFFLSWSSFFLPSLDSSVFFFSLFPSCRAHNCIIERLFSQLTLFPSPFPFCHVPDLSRLDTYIYVDHGTELYYLFIFTAERNEENNVGRHQGWVIR